MYVKKGWQGLLVVLFFLILVISCNKQLQQQNDVKATKNTSYQKQQIAKIDTQQIDNSKAIPTLIKPAYGTYFSEIAPEYAWLDTLTIEYIFKQKWLNYDNRDSLGRQNIDISTTYLSQEFRDMLPIVPMDSFNIYTAHWYGLDVNYSFKAKTRQFKITEKNKAYVHYQHYKNSQVLSKILYVNFREKHNGKPSSITVRLVRNLTLPAMRNDFPYDSLYVLASDSLRMPNGDKYDDFAYKAYEYGHDTIEIKPNQYPLNKKYRKTYIITKDKKYYNANEIFIYGANKHYQYIFDNATKKLLSAKNKMNYCFENFCPPNEHLEETKDLKIYYYDGTSNIYSPGKYPNDLADQEASIQNLLIKGCDTNNNNLIDVNENKTFSISTTNKKIVLKDLFASPPALPNEICWLGQQNILGNTYYFSIVNSHNYFSNNFQELNSLNNLITNAIIDHSNLDNAGSNIGLSLGPNGEFSGNIVLGVGDAQDDPNDPNDDNDNNSPFATLDIVGHKFTHNILRAFKADGDLDGNGEVYAIKEAFCDIFGFLIEREHTGADDYTIMNHARVDINRNMANPFASIPNPQPTYYQGRFWNDNADGHHRNGILNYWFYMLTNGGTFYPDRCDRITPDVFTVIPAGQCQPATITGIDPTIMGEVLFSTIISDEIESDVTFQELCEESTKVISMMIEDGGTFGVPCSNEGLEAINDFLTAWELIGIPCNINPNELPCDMGCGFLQPNDIWQTTSPIAYATNETSSGANNGSIEIHLGSTHNLEYHYTGPNGFSLVTTNNPVTGLANGLYNIDVYILGTYCLYNSYTATVGTNSGGGTPVCTFNQNLVFMRALPAIFNDQTIIEVELQEKPLQLNLAAFDMQGNPIQNLLNGQVLQTGTHQIPFNGSAAPNGLYIFSLAVSIPQCRTGAQESISIKGFKY